MKPQFQTARQLAEFIGYQTVTDPNSGLVTILSPSGQRVINAQNEDTAWMTAFMQQRITNYTQSFTHFLEGISGHGILWQINNNLHGHIHFAATHIPTNQHAETDSNTIIDAATTCLSQFQNIHQSQILQQLQLITYLTKITTSQLPPTTPPDIIQAVQTIHQFAQSQLDSFTTTPQEP